MNWELVTKYECWNCGVNCEVALYENDCKEQEVLCQQCFDQMEDDEDE